MPESPAERYIRLTELRRSYFELRNQMDCDRARVQDCIDGLFGRIEDAAQEAHEAELAAAGLIEVSA